MFNFNRQDESKLSYLIKLKKYKYCKLTCLIREAADSHHLSVWRAVNYTHSFVHNLTQSAEIEL